MQGRFNSSTFGNSSLARSKPIRLFSAMPVQCGRSGRNGARGGGIFDIWRASTTSTNCYACSVSLFLPCSGAAIMRTIDAACTVPRAVRLWLGSLPLCDGRPGERVEVEVELAVCVFPAALVLEDALCLALPQSFRRGLRSYCI